MKKQKTNVSESIRKFTSAILAVVMVISLFSFSLITTNATSSVGSDIVNVNDATVQKKIDGLVTRKTAEANEDGTFTLNLEAYVTGRIEQVHAKATDFIFVLDQSGSMAATGSKIEYVEEYKKGFTFSDIINHGDYYYIRDKVGDYYAVKCDNVPVSIGKPGKRFLYYDAYGKRNKLTNDILMSNTGIIYEGTLYRKRDKRDDLRAATSNFVELVQKNAQKYSIEHKIAMVGFANTPDLNKNVGYKNTGILTTENNEMISYEEATDHDYQNSLLTVNINGGVNPKIGDFNSGAIGKIGADSNTDTNTGLIMANKILEQYKNDGRNKVVIMFTDGEPGGVSNQTVNTTTANKAIQQANIAKNNYGVSLYTVGLYTENQDTRPGSQIDNFMNYVSSNYPNANYENDKGVVIGLKTSTEYYEATSDCSKLKNIFEEIAIRTVFPDIVLDTNAILQDVLTDEFILADESEKAISVFTANYIGNDSFGENQEFQDAKIAVDGQKIQVSNFDYAKNCCVDEGSGIKASGKKLVVKINVKRNKTTYGGNGIPTNTIASAIYDFNSAGIHYPVETFDIPTVNLSIKYDITPQDKSIYLSEIVETNELVNFPQEYTGEEDEKFEIDCRPDGINNKYVNITYKLVDKDKIVIAEKRVGAGQPLKDELFTKALDGLNENSKYTIEVGVSSIYEASSVNGAVETRTIQKEAIVYVFTPVIKPTDQTIFYGESADDLLERLNKVQWVCTDKVDVPDHGEPNITYDLKQVDGTMISNEIDLELDENLEIKIDKVKIGEKEYDRDFEYIDIEKVNDCELNDHNNDDSDFIIHVAKGELLIKKIINQAYSNEEKINSYQTFIYKIERRDEIEGDIKETFYQTLSFTANNNKKQAEATISDLKKGYYTVTEETTWSQKYTLKNTEDNYKVISGENAGKNLYIGSQLEDDKGYFGLDTHLKLKSYKGEPAQVSFTNTLNNWAGWYSDVAGSKNTFNK